MVARAEKANRLQPSPGRAETSARSPRSGASRKCPRSPQTAPTWLLPLLKWCSVVSFLVAVAMAIWWFDPRSRIEQFAYRPITAIQIEGHFQMIERQEVQSIVEPYVRSSFLELDIGDLKAHLETNPWIDSVTITRVWPDKLVVRLSEQQPIARWGENAFLNMRGDIIEMQNTTKIQSLPRLKGEDRYAKEIMEQYLRFGNILAQENIVLLAVELDQTRAWSLELADDKILRLGRDRLWEKLQHFLAAKHSMSAEDFARIKSVDMRYPSGFSVVWRKPQDDKYVVGG